MRPTSSVAALAIPGWRARPFLLTAAVLISLAVLPARLSTALEENSRHQQQDFGIFYRTAHCLWSHGCDPYAVAERSAPNLAPPHAHLLIAPVQALDRPAAYAGWLAISLGVLTLVVWRVVRELNVRMRGWHWLAGLAVVVSSGVMMSLVTSGQIYGVLAWPVTEAWIAWRRGHFSRAAVWLGAAASIKVLLLLPLLWFLIRGHWRAALTLVVTVTGIGAAGMLVFGAAAYGDWLVILSRAPIAGHFRDGSILATLTRTLDGDVHYAAVASAPSLIRPVWAALSGVVAAVALIKPSGRDHALLAVLAAATMIAPIGWIYAAWWFVGPAAGVWQQGTLRVRLALATAGLVLWLPDTAPLWGQPSALLTPLWGSLFLWVWAVAWGAGVSEVRLAGPAGR